MKLLSVLLVSFFALTASAQDINVEISGNIFNTEGDSIYISQFFGTYYEDLAGAKMKKDGTFKLKTSLPRADYYVLRFDKAHLNLILRDSANIKVYGDGKNISQFANILGSDESARMNEFLRVESNWKTKVDSANTALKENPSIQGQLNQYMQAEQQKYFQSVQTFIKTNPNSPALLPVLGSIDVNTDFGSYESIVKQLVAGFGSSPTIQNLYNSYEETKKQMYANDPLAPGKAAPDFTEALPSGEMMSLSSLKGKVVLLDFWASWCGPCRRENPNVVALYKKYKDDGFTVMSVSLDKSKEAWLAAIEKDGLIWPNHVSDLAHWACKAAKLYGVSGIPFTVLIDREGNIVQTKLRGPQLEAELARIFGH